MFKLAALNPLLLLLVLLTSCLAWADQTGSNSTTDGEHPKRI